MTKELKRISASQIQTLEKCSLIYWYKYILKIKDPPNDGARIGSICHDILELLSKEKYHNLARKLIQNPKYPVSLSRLIIKKFKSYDLIYNDKNLEKIKRFILVGLKNNFFIDLEGYEKVLFSCEEELTIQDTFNIIGYIDKYALFKDKDGDKFAVIFDYKSSKQKFSPKEISENVQALVYLLLLKEKYPEINLDKSYVNFVFLNFPDDPIQKVRANLECLNGARIWFEYIQNKIEELSFSEAIAGAAAKKGYPSEDEGFSGKLVCGRSCSPGELKKDGTVKYSCFYKFPFDYYGIFKDNELISTSLTEPKTGDYKKMRHSGCPFFNSK